jgi:hypothetical protein
MDCIFSFAWRSDRAAIFSKQKPDRQEGLSGKFVPQDAKKSVCQKRKPFLTVGLLLGEPSKNKITQPAWTG